MPNGQVKDISCRDMLRALDKSGKIVLPKAVTSPRKPSSFKNYIQLFLHDETPIETNLAML